MKQISVKTRRAKKVVIVFKKVEIVFSHKKMKVAIEVVYTPRKKIDFINYGLFEGGIIWANPLPTKVLVKMLNCLNDKSIKKHIIEKEIKSAETHISAYKSDISQYNRDIKIREERMAEKQERLKEIRSIKK